MVEAEFVRLLLDKDLRKLKNIKKVIQAVTDQKSFDELYRLIFHHERPLVMRAADAVEKITREHPDYLQPHKPQLLSILKSVDHKELKWHIAQLLPRLVLTTTELNDVWNILKHWALNPNESKIVRVNSLQGMFDISTHYPEYAHEFGTAMELMSHEMIPSIRARIKKLNALRSKT
jgi:hypothetical protein